MSNLCLSYCRRFEYGKIRLQVWKSLGSYDYSVVIAIKLHWSRPLILTTKEGFKDWPYHMFSQILFYTGALIWSRRTEKNKIKR